MSQDEQYAAFTGFLDLASEQLGGEAVAVSDDFFAPKENLLKPGRGVFKPGKFTDRGKWMDGWESRRSRTPGHDWCIIRLGMAGVVRGVDIDTNHFLGNHPPYASVEGVAIDEQRGLDDIEESDWTEVVPRSPLAPGSQNLFPAVCDETVTHLRLNIYPDGGVARFRVYGDVTPQLPDDPEQKVDIVALENGGRAVACSDMFFSPMDNLIMPGRAENMGQGWESRRRRGPGYDWVILEAPKPGYIDDIEVDTNHFKGNYPDRCSIETCFAPGEDVDMLTWSNFEWEQVMDEQKLEAHTRHFFDDEVDADDPVTHVKLNIFPDGGVSRLRVNGRFTDKGSQPVEDVDDGPSAFA